jgi:hypothetical protein
MVDRTLGTKELEMLEFAAQEYVRSAPEWFGRYTTEMLQAEVRQTSHGAMVRLKTFVLADRLPPLDIDRKTKAFFDFPSSPFQHWKSKHADTRWLGWLVRRWPVKTTEHVREVRLIVHLSRYRTYPLAEVPVPQDMFGKFRYGYELTERFEGERG